MPCAQLVEQVIWLEGRIPKAFLPSLESEPEQLLDGSSVCFRQSLLPKIEKMTTITEQLAGEAH